VIDSLFQLLDWYLMRAIAIVEEVEVVVGVIGVTESIGSMVSKTAQDGYLNERR
jgi:hypothetical protein